MLFDYSEWPTVSSITQLIYALGPSRSFWLQSAAFGRWESGVTMVLANCCRDTVFTGPA